MNVVVFGSCVTRDAFEYVDKASCVLLKYFARSSLGSAYAQNRAVGLDLSGINSAFQRGVVQADLLKEFPEYLQAHDFDLLVYDPIDERFDLLETRNYAICTLSNELAQTGARDLAVVNRVIRSGSDEFYQQWERGWEALISQLDQLGKRSALRINKVFWSIATQSGVDYAPTYDQARIRCANMFLRRLYLRMERDVGPQQVFALAPDLMQGADEHKWGLSPFHYVEPFYLELASRMANANQRPPLELPFNVRAEASVSGRFIESLRSFGLQNGQVIDGCGRSLPASKFTSNGSVATFADEVIGSFNGDAGVFELRLNLAQTIADVNGFSVCYFLAGWRQVNYLAVGYTAEGVFHHVKITNPAFDEWVESAIGSKDLIFGLQSRWEAARAAGDVSDLRLYVKGEPGAAGARVGYRWSAFWREIEPASASFLSAVSADTASAKARREEVIGAISRYVRKCNPALDQHVDAFMVDGVLPLTGEKFLDWKIDRTLPEQFGEVGTYRYLWHAMHPALSLMVSGRESGNPGPIFAARDYVSSWLERSFFTPDADIKFTWYDHGTAERLLALLLMHELGRQYAFDGRFMTRLRLAILRHGQLLESEAFYASHQASRYHNHAWFQDMALIAAAQIMDDFPCTTRWLQRGVDRLSDQLDKLIVRDHGYAIFVENSIGYHQGVQRLVEFAGELVSLSGSASEIGQVAQELVAWSGCLRYPDGRAPSQGDTFRRPNAQVESLFRGRPYALPECLVLPKAGYAIIKANHEQIPFMLCVFATSLCKTHKHEDNLSITLFFDGIEWLIDPSFYSHEYTQPVPAHLRSAWGHTNLILADIPYSIEPGCAWLDGAATPAGYSVQGKHTAYDGFEVSRTIEGSLAELSFVVTDKFSPVLAVAHAQAHSVWQCGEDVVAHAVPGGVELSHPGSHFRIRLTSHLPARIHEGWSDSGPFRGVAGSGFMEQKETTAVVFDLGNETKATIECFAVKPE